MPTYTYKCDKCDHEFDIVQRMSDDYYGVGYKQDRAQNGFRLFGKYYKDLWT